MHEDLNLAGDLALILISAGVITLLFRILKQPLILGYIVAGFLVGPHFKLFPDVLETAVVTEWSELGIIFLLFALGLEFSFKKLLRVGSSALITAGTIFLGMFLTGMAVGKALSWSLMECLFLGGMLSMSSTTIIIKAFGDLGLKQQKFASIVCGTLVVEDMLAILLMVLLSTMAVSKQFSGQEMLMSLFKLGFFLILAFLVGIFVIPTFLRKAHKYLNDETLLILSLGLCFAMVVFAGYAGFSTALGAFLMGSILAESIEGERIEKIIKGIKDLFGAVFFVSVGMMVDPAIIAQYWSLILILVVVVVGGITLFATSGVLLSGRPLRVAVRSGMSMAQVGEFAFIIAALGVSLGVVRSFIYPVIVAVSVITTFTTPYFIRFSEPLSSWLEKKLPSKWAQKLGEYTAGSRVMNRQSDWKHLITSYVLRVVLYAVLLVAVQLVCSRYVTPWIGNRLTDINPLWVKWIGAILTLLCMTPFLYGLALERGNFTGAFQRLWVDRRSNRGPLVALMLLRLFIAIAFVTAVFLHYFTFSYWVLFALVGALACLAFLFRRNLRRMSRIEQHFLDNLNQKDEDAKKKAPLRTSIRTQLSGRDIHVENVVVSPDSPYIGKKLKDIPFRREFGVNIIKIMRGSRMITLPSGEDVVYPFDTLLALGTDQQISRFIAVMEADTQPRTLPSVPQVVVSSFTIESSSVLLGKTLAQSGIRDAGCMVIGVERLHESIMNPVPSFQFCLGDCVWMVGEPDAFALFL